MLISIIIPYFKKKKYIKKAVRSILNQTYKNFEIIIIYDDPDLDDFKIIEELKKLDDRIFVIKNNKNLGAGESRNLGIKFSKGSYIAFIDSDDEWHINKLEKQISFMNKNNFLISHTSYNIINFEDKIIGRRTAKTLSHEELIKSCDIGLSSVMIKKDLFDDKTRFTKLTTKEDYVLWLIITKKGIKINALEEVLLNWRKVPDSLSSSSIRKIIDGYSVYRTYLKYGIFKSLYSLLILSLNYLKKNLL